jgi:hypothetical protein
LVFVLIGILAGTNYVIYNHDGTVHTSTTSIAPFATDKYFINSNAAYHIESNNPIAVTQYIKGTQAEPSGADKSDPFMLYLEPLEQFRSSDYSLTTPMLGYTSLFIQIIITTADVAGLKLDGAAVSSLSPWSQDITTTLVPYTIVVVPITEGTHRISHDYGVSFCALFYGHGSTAAWAMMALPTPSTYHFTSYISNITQINDLPSTYTVCVS